MKKVLSMILCIVFITTLLPIASFPAKAADDLEWEYDSGILTISGTGDMSFDTIPWNGYKRQIQEVVIGNGVTSIQANAFSDCTTLTDVTIPGSVMHIGNNAFYNCLSLEYIIIPKSVNEIGEYVFSNSGLKRIRIPSSVKIISKGAFLGCVNLTQITISSGVTKIGEEAFAQCTNFYGVTFPKSVTEIGKRAFYNCQKLHTTYVWNNTISIGSEAFLGCSDIMICCTDGSAAHTYAAENGHSYGFFGAYSSGNDNWYYDSGSLFIRGEGEMSFDTIPWESYKDEIKSVSIEDMISVQAGAFEGYPALESVFINGAMETIGESAFKDCAALNSLVLHSDRQYDGVMGVMEIGDYAFSGCTSLAILDVPSGTTHIGEGAFENCTSLERAIILGKTNIGECAFSGCEDLVILCNDKSQAKKYADENNIKCLKPKEYGFDGIYGKARWTLDEEGTLIISGSGNIGDGMEDLTPWKDMRSDIKKVIVDAGIDTIGYYVFYDCENLESVKFLAKEPMSFMRYAFGGTTKVKEVHITNLAAWCGTSFGTSDANPLSTGAKLYVNGELLEHLVIPEGVKSIGRYAFYNCEQIKSLTLPEGLEHIYDYAFSGCNFTKIKIPVSLKSIGSQGFYSNVEREVYVDDINLLCNYIGTSFSTVSYNLYLNDELVTHIVIPDGIVDIGTNAFRNCKSIEKVTIPKSVQTIGVNAFNGCTEIKEVYIEDLDAWCNIWFSKLGTVSYGENNPLQYGAGLYLNGELVTDVLDMKTVNPYSFYGYKWLKNVTISDGVTIIDEYAFYKCTALEKVTIPDSVYRIYDHAFEDTPFRNDNEDYGEDGLLYSGKSLIAAKTDITSANIKEGTTNIAGGAFRNCVDLKEITLPDGLREIGGGAFETCTSIESLEIPESVERIQSFAIFGSPSLSNVTINGKDTYIIGHWYNVPKDLVITCQMESRAVEFATSNNFRYRYFGSDIIYGGSNTGNNTGTIGGGGGGGGGSSKPKDPEPVVGLENVKAINEYRDDFTDVASDAWYYDSVKTAFELDLVKGAADGKYNPTGNMTIAEAITLASRIYSIYNTGKSEFVQGDVWYQVYVNYAITNGIIKDGQFADFNKVATRTEFAEIFAKAIPESNFDAINNIEKGKIPDVDENDAVYLLYNAGILAGSDDAHSFKPDSNIQRSEVATIITRIVDKEKRVTFQIE